LIEPTSGRLDIRGEAHALLQIGGGFHPELTGRQNAYAYLANFGRSGAAADRAVDDIIGFSELEEYIDQPLKTYSTGMQMRLIFAASTTIAPKLFVVDEVLGVGDAYFQNKSFGRIQALCENNGTTLLLVSHNVYSAAKLCERMIWIDCGRIKYDGDPKTALNLYESSIKDQEEQRLAKRRLDAAVRNDGSRKDNIYLSLKPVELGDDDTERIYGLAIGRIRVSWPGGESEGEPIVDPGEGNWGEVKEIAGREGRPFMSYGSIFRKLGVMVAGEGLADALACESAEIELEVFAPAPLGLNVVALHPWSRREYGGVIRLGGEGWRTISLRLRDVSQVVSELSASRYGTRHFEIVKVSFHDANMREAQVFRPLQDLIIQIQYRINDPAFRERPVIVVGFQKDGTIRTHRFWTDGLEFCGTTKAKEGIIEVAARPLQLGAGEYLVTVSVFREGYFKDRNDGRFFSINEKLLDMHARAYEIKIEPDPENPLINDVIFNHPAHWRRIVDPALGTNNKSNS
jgi:ABC-type multidrug transport system ATPase subunit